MRTQATSTSPIAATSAGGRWVVLGLGATGFSSAGFLHRLGHAVTVMDSRARPPMLERLGELAPAITVTLGKFDRSALEAADYVLLSPGLSSELPDVQAAKAAGAGILGDIELFARYAKAPVIAVTGTNGKSTVTELISAMLRNAGKEVRSGGNLGTPALDLLTDNEPDCYVLELSSFQLELTDSLAPSVACLLNVTPDHLDRHHTFDAYLAAKARIFAHARTAVINADDEALSALSYLERRVEFTLGRPGDRRYGVTEIAGEGFLAAPDGALMPVRECPLIGRHNIANALAAIAVCEVFGTERAAALEALRGFTGLPHRTEKVAEFQSVVFVDDSKATNPGAAIASVEGLLADCGGVVIAGGESKGVAFDAFADCVSLYAHDLILIGKAASEIRAVIAGRVPCFSADCMESAVRAAAERARSGEVVLLAPACASFDMFRDYRHRGTAFRDAVLQLRQQ